LVAKANLWGGDIRETLSLVRDRGESIEQKQAGLSTDRLFFSLWQCLSLLDAQKLSGL